ncbi:MAG: hypothetical protein VKJ04_07355 [Vampirovibrionales bacterium]|nr:hypothetical protein [Vampirovibrionales bacterium]
MHSSVKTLATGLLLAFCIGSHEADAWSLTESLPKFLPWKKGQNAKTGQVVNPAENRRYYDVYLVGNQMCRQCAIIPVNEYQMGLVNKAGKSVVVRSVDIVGVDTHPFMRKVLERIVRDTDIVGEIITAPGYDPLQSWRDEIRERPAPSPVNEPEG